jgi:N4-gp56 family major capsid protein|tara:strand:+ start:2110 stop:3300 length:1191 start_codon:yes stop_codon:yes gene_type:complete
MPDAMNMYNDPAGGTASTLGSQFNTFKWHKKAIIDAKKEMYFTPLADVMAMPKNFGKTIKVFQYIPLLDDRNINDQGLDAAGSAMADGNLYGSSRDVGTITSRMPTLSETGGRVNRVGFTRVEREGSIVKLGFFTEFTQEAFDFDTDEMLYEHLSRELVTGATQMSEAILQMDLLAGAGVIVYSGAATTDAEMTAEGGTPSIVDYDDLQRLHTTLKDNRSPMQTKVITGSRMIDTKTINSGRVLYIGTELESTVKAMTDPFGNAAFIPLNQYADAGTPLNGEIGTVDQFRIVSVPEMLHWAGEGAAVASNPGYRATGGNYDVFPMLTIGAESFTTIGFQTDGKTVKFKIITKMPGEKTADRTDPFGEQGFSSIKWYYGTLIMRSERLALIKTVARQ